jgi:hypothetical protein
MPALPVGPEAPPPADGLTVLLPGPDRKRSAAVYRYRVTYRAAEPQTAGCLMTWEVCGGRMAYQIAVERQEGGRVRLHCTCADAVFRGELTGQPCKHVRGLVSVARLLRRRAAALARSYRRGA